MKRTMNALALTALLVSSNAFAGKEDLKVMNTLFKVGAQSEQFMSQIHVGLDDISCSYSHQSDRYECAMTDISANEGQGAPLILSGRKAAKVFAILLDAGATPDNGMGKFFVGAKSLRCTQSVEGVADGSAADRTGCSIELAE